MRICVGLALACCVPACQNGLEAQERKPRAEKVESGQARGQKLKMLTDKLLALEKERKGVKLNREEAALLACMRANDHVEKHRRFRPFKPDSFKIRMKDEKWVWGEHDPMGVERYSAVVSFRPDVTDFEMTVFFPVNGSPAYAAETQAAH